MITAEQILSGALPTTKRLFNIAGIGQIELHRLPAYHEAHARQLFGDENADPKQLETLAQNNTYYMLFGEFNDEAAQQLVTVMDINQLGLIHTTGLFFMDLEQSNLTAIEKNS